METTKKRIIRIRKRRLEFIRHKMRKEGLENLHLTEDSEIGDGNQTMSLCEWMIERTGVVAKVETC